MQLLDHPDWASSIRFSPDGKMVAVVGGSGTVALWDTGTGSRRHSLDGHTADLSNCDFSPDGTLLATASYDQSIRVWNVAERRCVCALRVDSPLYACAWKPDGSGIAAAGLHGTYLFDYLP